MTLFLTVALNNLCSCSCWEVLPHLSSLLFENPVFQYIFRGKAPIFDAPILKQTWKNCRNPKIMLLVPLTVFNGVEQAFVIGIFTKVRSSRLPPCNRLFRKFLSLCCLFSPFSHIQETFKFIDFSSEFLKLYFRCFWKFDRFQNTDVLFVFGCFCMTPVHPFGEKMPYVLTKALHPERLNQHIYTAVASFSVVYNL